MNYLLFPHRNESWFIPNWLWRRLPDSSKGRFRWHRSHKRPCMVHLKTLDLTVPRYRIRLLRDSELQSPIVAYGRTLEELTPTLKLYQGRSPLVERYDSLTSKWTSFTSCKL